MKALLERVKRATEERGKKTELANFLRVNPVQVSHWLSGFRSPMEKSRFKCLLGSRHRKENKKRAPLAVRLTPPGARPVQLNPVMKKEKQACRNGSGLPAFPQAKILVHVLATQAELDCPGYSRHANGCRQENKKSLPRGSLSGVKHPHNEGLDPRILEMGSDWTIEKRRRMAEIFGRWARQLNRSAEILTARGN